MSASAPAGRLNKNMGKVDIAWTRATWNGSGFRPVISQPAAAFCIQLPTLENTAATKSTVKVMYRNGVHAEPLPSVLAECDVCICVARLIMPSSSSQKAKQLQPSAPQKDRRSLIGGRADRAAAWSWPWMPRWFAQPQAAASDGRATACTEPPKSPQAA